MEGILPESTLLTKQPSGYRVLSAANTSAAAAKKKAISVFYLDSNRALQFCKWKYLHLFSITSIFFLVFPLIFKPKIFSIYPYTCSF